MSGNHINNGVTVLNSLQYTDHVSTDDILVVKVQVNPTEFNSLCTLYESSLAGSILGQEIVKQVNSMLQQK